MSEQTYPRTYTCHPKQNWKLGRSGLAFSRCILVIHNAEEQARYDKALASMNPRYNQGIREVTPESLGELLTGQAALPDATKGTNSETARLAAEVARGQVAQDQLASQQADAYADTESEAPAPAGTAPVTVGDLAKAADEVGGSGEAAPQAAPDATMKLA